MLADGGGELNLSRLNVVFGRRICWWVQLAAAPRLADGGAARSSLRMLWLGGRAATDLVERVEFAARARAGRPRGRQSVQRDVQHAERPGD